MRPALFASALPTARVAHEQDTPAAHDSPARPNAAAGAADNGARRHREHARTLAQGVARRCAPRTGSFREQFRTDSSVPVWRASCLDTRAPMSLSVHESLPVREITLHGHTFAYRVAGRGPVLVLLHGITCSSETWADVIPALAAKFTVIAPDLLGHGRSSKPKADYSVGAYASAVRDLLLALGHGRATVVGHSLGGGIALQFAYQFPQMVERLVLVSSGGLGPEVHPIFRMAAVPGSEWVLPSFCSERLRRVVDLGASLL